MPVRLENLSDRPVLLILSSGDTLRLAPGETSEGLEDVEVRASAKVDKLVGQGVITVHEPPKRSAQRQAKRSTQTQEGEKSAEETKKTTE
jgi:hypothetical protein